MSRAILAAALLGAAQAVIDPPVIHLHHPPADPANSLRQLSPADVEELTEAVIPNTTHPSETDFVVSLSAINRRRLWGGQERRRLSTKSVSHSYSYSCEAKTKCDLPKASALDYWDGKIKVIEKDYELKNGAVVEISKCCDTSRPASYEILYDAFDKSGNKAQQVTINLQVIDSVKPVITVCGGLYQTVEAGMAFTLCNTTTAIDNSDGDITAKMKIETYHDHHLFPSNGIKDCPKPCTFGPHNLGNIPGRWTFKYSVSDASGNIAVLRKVVTVKDTLRPRITVLGSDTVVHECGLPYSDDGATALDNLDGRFAPRVYGTMTRRSCMDVKTFDPLAKTGTYTIRAPTINNSYPMQVHCDMDTDGGGYTYLKIDNAKSTHFFESNFLNPENFDSCQKLGLQMAVWRTETQQMKLIDKYGITYFQVAPGIVGTSKAENTDLTSWAMNSKTRNISKYYRAVDNGHWFIRETPFGEPNGDYQAGCYLGIFGFNPVRFNDDMCSYQSGTHYICSTNDKGGPGVLPPLPPGVDKNYPPVNVPGEYYYVFQATDSSGNDARPRRRKVIVLDTVPPTVKLKTDSSGTTFTQRFIYKTELFTIRNERHTTGAYAGVCPHGVICTGTPGVDEVLSLEDPGAECRDLCDGIDTFLPGEWNAPFNFQVAGVYKKTYACNDTSGNAAKQVRTWVVINDYSPRIDMYGDAVIVIEPFPNSTYTELGAQCTDKQDCPKDPKTGQHTYCLNNVTKMNIPVPIDPTTPGDYYVYFSCVDSDGMAAPDTYRIVRVKDTICPTARLEGAKTVVTEAGFAYKDPVPPATAWDINCNCSITNPTEKNGLHFGGFAVGGNTVDISRSYYTHGSCLKIKEDMDWKCSRRTAVGLPCEVLQSGEYYITTRPHNAIKAVWESANNPSGRPQAFIRLKVWCDFDTDGGGYTSHKITGGIHTTRADQNNSCTDVGLQMIVPRTEWHFAFLAHKYGKSHLAAVPGVYGLAAGNYMMYAMNSGVAQVAANWKAIDGGQWFIRSTKFVYPRGTYTPGCWLGMDDWFGAWTSTQGVTEFGILDDYCNFGVTNYICSTNDKGGPVGVPPGNKRFAVKNHQGPIDHYPSGAEAGKYVIQYHVKDWGGNSECVTPTRTVVVRDTLAPRIFLWNASGTLLKETQSENIANRAAYGGRVSSIVNRRNSDKWENFKDLNQYQERRFAAGYQQLLSQLKGPQNAASQQTMAEQRPDGQMVRLAALASIALGMFALTQRPRASPKPSGYLPIDARQERVVDWDLL